MNWNLPQSIVATLAYGELFDYPLTSEELYRWLIADSSYSYTEVHRILVQHQQYKEFFALSNIKKKFVMRQERKKASEEKWKLVKSLPGYFALIPTLELVGVSGGLSMNNADSADDIDFFFIVTPGTIWISRLLVVLLLHVLGKRRTFGDSNEKNKWCTNMFMTSNILALPQQERDVYTAHEFLQLVPVFERNGMYQQFLYANEWVKKILPNAWNEKKETASIDKKKWSSNVIFRTFRFFLLSLNSTAKYLELWYMKSHRTTEVISDTVLRFHPQDIRLFIKKRYSALLQKYKIPLDSRFLL